MLTSIVNNNLQVNAAWYTNPDGSRFNVPEYFKPTKNRSFNTQLYISMLDEGESGVSTRNWVRSSYPYIYNLFLRSNAGKKFRPKRFKRKNIRDYKRRSSTSMDAYLDSLGLDLGPIEEEIIPQDRSFSVLFNLMQEGYDLVTWAVDQVDGKTCPKCLAIADMFMSAEEKPGKPAGFFTLPEFLGYKAEPILDEKGVPMKDESGAVQYNYVQTTSPYEHNAPIYDWSHPRCRCTLLVCKSNNPNDCKMISADGEK